MVGDAATQFSLSCPVPACRLVQDVGHRLDRGQIVTLLAAVALSPILGAPVGSIKSKWVSMVARGQRCFPFGS